MAQVPTVFIVDDDEAIRDSLEMLLRTRGIPVRTFASAGAFLEGYDDSLRGCLLLDLKLPGMDGQALLRHLQECGCALPVVMMTAHGDIPIAVEAMRQGARDFLEKPLDPQLLLRRLLGLLEEPAELHADVADLQAHHANLTPREAEVMGRVVRGLPNRRLDMPTRA